MKKILEKRKPKKLVLTDGSYWLGTNIGMPSG